MNNDGWGFNGAGTSDNRVIGPDLQHARNKVKKGTNKAKQEGPQYASRKELYAPRTSRGASRSR